LRRSIGSNVRIPRRKKGNRLVDTQNQPAEKSESATAPVAASDATAPDHRSSSPPGSPGTDSLADSVVILLSLTAVQRLVGFARSVLFCRWLDPGQLGQWDMAFSFLMLAAPLSIIALPAAFGRYVEHYRQRGHLRTLLVRTALACVALVAASAAVVNFNQTAFSRLIFGSPDHTHLVQLLAVSLVTVVAFNFSVDLLTAMRSIRLLAAAQLINSLGFACLGVGLLLFVRASAGSVVVAYGGACLLTVAVLAVWRLRSWQPAPRPEQNLPQVTFWGKLLPYVGWVTAGSLMANLFEIADRYMIVHHAGTGAEASLAMVGQYHSSRVVPVLLVSVALMLGGMITPHLSDDWERGRRREVGLRLNLFLKMLAFGLCAAAVGVLLLAPLLFGIAFEGKFAGGRAVLPWTLVYCIWFGLTMVAQNYLLCAERARLGSIALLVGLTANVGLNLLLLPRLGLLGAVLATSAANAVALVLVCAFAGMLGFRLDRGTRLMFAVPVSLAGGPWVAGAVLVAVAYEAARGTDLLSVDEKHLLGDMIADYWRRGRALLPRHRSASANP
jgi:O-antigen/teichoic acid export membrane protein